MSNGSRNGNLGLEDATALRLCGKFSFSWRPDITSWPQQNFYHAGSGGALHRPHTICQRELFADETFNVDRIATE